MPGHPNKPNRVCNFADAGGGGSYRHTVISPTPGLCFLRRRCESRRLVWSLAEDILDLVSSNWDGCHTVAAQINIAALAWESQPILRFALEFEKFWIGPPICTAQLQMIPGRQADVIISATWQRLISSPSLFGSSKTPLGHTIAISRLWLHLRSRICHAEASDTMYVLVRSKRQPPNISPTQTFEKSYAQHVCGKKQGPDLKST